MRIEDAQGRLKRHDVLPLSPAAHPLSERKKGKWYIVKNEPMTRESTHLICLECRVLGGRNFTDKATVTLEDELSIANRRSTAFGSEREEQKIDDSVYEDHTAKHQYPGRERSTDFSECRALAEDFPA